MTNVLHKKELNLKIKIGMMVFALHLMALATYPLTAISQKRVFAKDKSKTHQSATQIRIVERVRRDKIKGRKQAKSEQKPFQQTPKHNIAKKIQRPKGHDQLKAAYYRYIKETIDKRKFYPKVSQRLGHSGQVLLEFTIHKSGEIQNLGLIKECPFKKLNLSALKTLKAIAKFDPIPENLALNSLDIQVPIVYNLQ